MFIIDTSSNMLYVYVMKKYLKLKSELLPDFNY